MIKLFPLLAQDNNAIFSLNDCRFRIEKCKESTGRVVCFREFNIANSFTLESTFYGPKDPSALGKPGAVDRHMNEKDFINLGKSVAETLIQFIGTR